jgi:1,4-dihydroxy-2-naphthoate polyprenyltransferase
MSIKEWFIVWFKAARAPFLVVSFVPCIVGGIIAYYRFPASFDWLTFILVTIGIVAAHSAGDFVDDYFDFKTGNLGNKEKQFHDSPLIDGKVTSNQVLFATILFLAISAGIGIYLLFQIGMPVIIMAAIGAFIVLFYTSPPLKMNYRGLGETMLFVAFGPLLVFGVYFVLTRQFSFEPILISIPLGVFTMNVGLVSNTFDYFDDVESGKKSLPVRFGQKFAANLVGIANIIGYLALIVGVLLNILPVWTLLAFLCSPLAIISTNAVKKFSDTKFYTMAMTRAIALSAVTGIIFCVAYIIAIFV